MFSSTFSTETYVVKEDTKTKKTRKTANNLGLTIVYVPIILAANDTPMQLNLFMANEIFRPNSLPHGYGVAAVSPATLFVLPCQTTLARYSVKV